MTVDKVNLSDRTVADLIGQVTWLMTQSPEHRGLFISDLEWLVMPAILHKQFRVFLHEGQPKAVIFWAWVSEDVAKRIKPLVQKKMRYEEWVGENELVIVDAVAPFGNRTKLVREFESELWALGPATVSQ